MRPINCSAIPLLAISGVLVGADAASYPDYLRHVKGFKNATIEASVGGQAMCISGMVEVAATTKNVDVALDIPQNQIDLTNLILEWTQMNSTLESRILGKSHDISGTYEIYSQLCFPTGSLSGSTVQFLVHGGGFDRQYWNNAPGYSYVDYAASRGQITFLYDRLGVGRSDHPDPLQVVQTSMHVAIAHELVRRLRSGSIGVSGQGFKHVVGVGHSYGSAQLLGVTIGYPEDLDAVVLTGAAAEPDGMTINTVGQVQTIAALNDPSRFSQLSPGYILPGYIEGLQYGFFRAPQFDPDMLELAEKTKQPQGLGEFLVFGGISPAANFTGPVYVLNGEHDLPACFGNCVLPYNRAATLKDVLFPSASNGSGWYLVPGTGHGVNYHYTATDAYAHIYDFVEQNGF